MSKSEAYLFSDGNYSGIYCEAHANEAWRDYARTVLDNTDEPSAAVSDIDERRPEHLDDDRCSNRGEYCEQCTEEVCPPYFHCEGCGNYGWVEEGFETVVGNGDVDWDSDDPTTPWCDDCEEQNGPKAGPVLVDDDGRDYTLRFVETYTGDLTYPQPPLPGDRYGMVYAKNPTPVYRAGCRRLTAADALRHWGARDHYAPGAADLLFRAVLAHAMRRALPRLRNRLVDPLTPFGHVEHLAPGEELTMP